MPKFLVEVEVVKSSTYTVEVEDADCDAAEESATKVWRDNVGEDFQVDKPDIWNILDCEQLTWECQECKAPIATHAEYIAHDEMCAKCHTKAVQTEIDYWNETPERVAQSFWCSLCAAVARGAAVFDPETRSRWEVRRPQVPSV